jgi:hypothetical protein
MKVCSYIVDNSVKLSWTHPRKCTANLNFWTTLPGTPVLAIYYLAEVQVGPQKHFSFDVIDKIPTPPHTYRKSNPDIFVRVKRVHYLSFPDFVVYHYKAFTDLKAV